MCVTKIDAMQEIYTNIHKLNEMQTFNWRTIKLFIWFIKLTCFDVENQHIANSIDLNGISMNSRSSRQCVQNARVVLKIRIIIRRTKRASKRNMIVFYSWNGESQMKTYWNCTLSRSTELCWNWEKMLMNDSCYLHLAVIML